jgi:hypothetical protein
MTLDGFVRGDEDVRDVRTKRVGARDEMGHGADRWVRRADSRRYKRRREGG